MPFHIFVAKECCSVLSICSFFFAMEPKIIDWCLSADEIEEFLRVLEIRLQCREIERHLATKKHMTLLLHAQLCRKSPRVSSLFLEIL